MLLLVLLGLPLCGMAQVSRWQLRLDSLQKQAASQRKGTLEHTKSLNALASHLNDNRRFQAGVVASQAMAQAQRMPQVPELLYTAWTQMGRYYYIAARFDSSYQIFDLLKSKVNSVSRDPFWLAEAQRGMALARFGQGLYPQSSLIGQEAIKAALKSGDHRQLGLAYRNYAFIYGMNGIRKKVYAYNDSALKYLALAGDSLNVAGTYDNIAIVSINEPDSTAPARLKEGLQYNAAALAYMRRAGYDSFEGMAYLTRSGLFLRLQQLDSAQHYIDQAIMRMRAEKNHRNLAAAYVTMSRLKEKRKRYDQQLAWAMHAYQLSDSIKALDIYIQAGASMGEAYLHMNRYKEAHEVLSHRGQLINSQFGERIRMSLIDAEERFDALLKEEKIKQRDLTIKTEKQKSFYLMLSLSLLVALLVGAGIFLIRQRNTTQLLKQKNQIIEEQNRHLETLNSTKDTLFSLIAHDLRAPLASYITASGLLEMLLENQDYEGIEELATLMRRTGNSYATMVDNLLQWAQKQVGGFSITKERVIVLEVIQEVEAFFAKTIGMKQLNLHIDAAPDYALVADRSALHVILRNIIGNALKFTPLGGHIYISARQIDGHHVINVRDTGMGMDEAQMAMLFMLDMRKRRVGTAGEASHGLGMVLVKEMTDLHEGSVAVSSAPSQGTLVTVNLPVLEAPVAPLANGRQRTVAAQRQGIS